MNNKADKYNELKQLCDDFFISYMIRQYAGARAECLYCGNTKNNNGIVKHDTDCPIIRYKEIMNNE